MDLETTETGPHTCPVCLLSSDENDETVYCRTPCSHVLCQSCAEHLLLLKPHSNTEDAEEDIYRSTPTLGLCPICRASICLLDLQRVNAATNDDGTTTDLYETNDISSTWPVYRSSFHPIVGANEQQRYGAPDVETLPILSFSDPPHVNLRGWGLDVDVGDRGEEWTATFDSSFFFEKAMTFHGRASTVTNGPEHRRIHATELECVAQFSHDLQFIRAGYIRWKWDPVRYPLDGTWKVSWTSDADASATITVCAHTFQHGGTYQIDSESNGSSHTPRFEWPSADGTLPAVVQTSNVSIPPGTFGPNVGEEIRWTTTSTDERYQTIVWTRLSRNSTKVLSLASPFTPIVYRVPTENDPLSDIPPHNPNGIWGNVFCQANSVGLASYHFDPDSFRNACTDDAATNVNVNVNANAAMRTPTEVSAYISYENPHTRVWPALDNGAPIPARVPFRRVSWDPGERLFRGEICWVEDFQTTWQGCAKWCYRIKFDSSFTCIVSGGCLQYVQQT